MHMFRDFGAIWPLNRLSICSFVGASPGGHAAKANLASESTLLLMSAFTSSVVRLTSKPLERKASLDSRSVPMTDTAVRKPDDLKPRDKPGVLPMSEFDKVWVGM